MNTSIQNLVNKAIEHEKKYEWIEASNLYDNALKIMDEKDIFKQGKIQEKKAHSLYRAAFQNEKKEEFFKGLKKAIDAYSSAHGLFKEIKDEQVLPWIFRCEAFSKYL
jgi:hypothetical protein